MDPKLLQRLWFKSFDAQPKYKHPPANTQEEPALPETLYTMPSYCSGLSVEKELECLEKLFPNEITPERVQKIKDQLDAILRGKSLKAYDDGDGLNLDGLYRTE